MKRLLALAVVLVACWAGSVSAAVVTQRWGMKGHVQHAGTLQYRPHGDRELLLRFDLSALPKDAEIYRARLFFTRSGLYGGALNISPVEPKTADGTDGSGQPGLKPVGAQLNLVPPYFQWFDATEAVRRWTGDKRNEGSLLLRDPPAFDRDATYLEIAYEGRPAAPPKQVTGIKAFYRSGQVFITFREIEDYAGGKEEVTWGELGKRFQGIDGNGPVPRDEPREIRYRVYMHEKPITPETIGSAELLAEVVPGSMYNTRLVPGGDFIKQRPEAVALRLAIEPGKPLAPGSGLYVHTVRRAGRRYYAVVTAVNGVENTVHLSGQNTAGPIEQRPERPEPVLQAVPKAHGHQNAGITELRDGAQYHEDWYSYWTVPPESPWPARYGFAVGYCPQTMSKPAPLTFTRGHTWGPNPEMPRPEPRRGIVMSMSVDNPNGFWTGVNDARGTLKGIEEGTWQPFTQNRQEALIRWAQRTSEVDSQRIVSAIGAWGMWELRRPDLYATIHGWGMPEVTKGFQCWNWARGAWGPPEAYQDKPDGQNPFYLQDYTRYVLEDPQRELPYFWIHTGWGAHFTEMGWPPFPRFVRAMIDTKQAFTMQPGAALRQALAERTIDIRRDQSLPAFGNCSLDDNIGSGELGTGEAFGQVNAYLLWDTESIVDQPDRWEMTVWLDESAPLPECTVDLTPRRCQRFQAAPGQRFTWTSTLEGDGRKVAQGDTTADRHGLVTIPQMCFGKARHRITIQRK